jgi:hypothetical protein
MNVQGITIGFVAFLSIGTEKQRLGSRPPDCPLQKEEVV